MAVHQELSNFIWQIADLLRGPYRPPQYERVMLPLTVLRRFDCVLEPTKESVLAQYAAFQEKLDGPALDATLNRTAGQRFHNRSKLNFQKLKGDPDRINDHLADYILGFSENVQVIFERFNFAAEIAKMHEANILYLVVSKFNDVDLRPERVKNRDMGLLFEDLIRRFNETANETAGDHFTPREVIELMVDILLAPDNHLLQTPRVIRKIFDPACGTGGMLSEAQNQITNLNSEANVFVYGQDFNPRAYAIAASDLLLKGHENSRIEFGDSLIRDKFEHETFDYFLANPPFGVDWKRQQKEITDEHEKRGYAGRFGAGLPRVNDGSLLFLQHMIDKFDKKDGSRLAIVFSGSPLFTGGAGSGESNIRKWIIENDWLEAVIALPEQMFYNTGIGTYVWIVTNRKVSERKGRIQLIDARERWKPGASKETRRSLGDKRRHISEEDIRAVVRKYGDFSETPASKIFDNNDFGYRRVTVERPLRLRYQMSLERKAAFLNGLPGLLDVVQGIDKALGREPQNDWNGVWAFIEAFSKDQFDVKWTAAEQKLFRSVFTERDPSAIPVVAKREKMKRGDKLTEQDRWNGWFPAQPAFVLNVPTRLDYELPIEGYRVRFEPDAELRDFENIPLKEDVNAYFCREVLPHVPDAWMDRDKDKVGYEINFNRYFYRYTPPRPLSVIDAELKTAEETILRLLQEVTE